MAGEKAVGMVMVAGWEADYYDEHTDRVVSLPVVAFSVMESGRAEPLISNSMSLELLDSSDPELLCLRTPGEPQTGLEDARSRYIQRLESAEFRERCLAKRGHPGSSEYAEELKARAGKMSDLVRAAAHKS